MKFQVIGITDNPHPFFPPEVLEVIKGGTVFSGGKRHHEIVAHLLPEGATWIDITVPLSAVFEQYLPHEEVIVFASGDPLFFGFANTLQREFPHLRMQVFPSFNSLQMLAHRLLLPYHDLRIVSLTGRPWHEFDRALIECAPKLGVLTDKEHTPAAIAQRMLDYGYTDYQMHIGEHLGNPTLERVSTLSLIETAERDFTMPNCLILCSQHSSHSQHSLFGIPDNEFSLLHGREKMITKMPIRLLTLQALDLPHRHTLWDIGFCTGSVSIEARLLFPHLHITAFEVRPEGEALMRENARRFGAPGITAVIGDFLAVTGDSGLSGDSGISGESRTPRTSSPPKTSSPFPVGCNSVAAKPTPPDTAFIGGHNGQLKAIMARLASLMPSGGIIVMNSVTPQSKALFQEACQELHLIQHPSTHIQLNDNNPIDILKCELP